MSRMRVLLVTRNLPPLLGGMENLNFRLAVGLQQHAELVVAGPAASANLWPGRIYRKVPLRPLWIFLIGLMMRSLGQAWRWKPDVVIGGSGLVAPVVLAAARISGAHAVLYVHGLDLAVRNRIYQLVWGSFIRRADAVICNSAPTAQLAQSAGVPDSCLHIVCPGVDIDITHFSTVELTEFRTGHCLGVRPVLLSVGRLTARKGLLEFVRHSMPLIVQRFPDALLVVIGDTPSDALHAIPQSKDSILRGALEVGVGENIRFLGRVDDRELACAYQTSQVHVFPVIQIPGDPEGFGMVAIEAAACALPTVAFACGGVIDAVSDGRSGFLVHPGDYLELATRICDILSSKVDLSLSSVEFARRFDWTHFNAGIRAVLERLDDS